MLRVRKVKPWWASSIIWVNVLHGGFSAAVATLPLLQQSVSLQMWAALNVVVNAVLVGLRFATSDPVIIGKIRSDEDD